MDLHPIVYLTAFTGVVVGYFVWRGSGSLLKAIFAIPVTWAFVMVLPFLALFFLAYVAGYPRSEYATAWAEHWPITLMFAENFALWAWMAWKRFT